MSLEHPVITNMERTGYPDGVPPKPVFICSSCGEDILNGQDYWDVLGEQFCERCINRCHRIAELSED